MRLELNWTQRGLLLLAGVLMLLFAANTAESYTADHWLATGQFLVAIALFVVAASSRKGPADAE